MRDRTENQIMLAFIRHGATQANKERRYLGKTDESLSEEGIEILESYKMQKLYPDVEYLFTSPMKDVQRLLKLFIPHYAQLLFQNGKKSISDGLNIEIMKN